MDFRPRLWPTLFTAPSLIVLVGLGSWQLDRLEWKRDLIDKLRTRSTAAAVGLPTASADLESFEFQRVSVTGAYRHDRELYLVSRSLRGNPGYHVLTPLARADGQGAVLVNRGWVPFDKRDPASRAEGQLQGLQTVEGIVRLRKRPGIFTPDNDPVKNDWFSFDMEAMSRATGVELASGYYVVSDVAPAAGLYPVGRQWRLDIRNDHFEYALTWYALAAALLIIYFLYHRRKE